MIQKCGVQEVREITQESIVHSNNWIMFNMKICGNGWKQMTLALNWQHYNNGSSTICYMGNFNDFNYLCFVVSLNISTLCHMIKCNEIKLTICYVFVASQVDCNITNKLCANWCLLQQINSFQKRSQTVISRSLSTSTHDIDQIRLG